MADPAAPTDEELAEMAAFLIWVGHQTLCLVGDACDCEAITEGTRRLIAALRASRAEVATGIKAYNDLLTIMTNIRAERDALRFEVERLEAAREGPSCR